MKTIFEAAAALRQRQVTPLDLVEQCLQNIDRWEPGVKAWVFVDRDGARDEARRLTEELRRGQRRGPLHGIPLAIKDIFDVFDWPTAAGSKLWGQAVARQDAEVIRRLRDGGAIFLGKTVTTTYASFDPPVTRNPWNAARTPGGSSSGSAAALATGMCFGAMGSQTGGSITRPASFCGVAGLKPTFGRVACDGVMPLSPSMDHPGPMGRCVRDLGLMFQVLADRAANFEMLLAEEMPPPLLGRVRGLFEELAEPAVVKMMDDVHKELNKSLPSPIEELALPPLFGEVVANHRVIMAVEAAVFHRTRLQRHPEDYPPKIRSLIEEGLAYPAPEYGRCLENQRRLKLAMKQFNKYILLTPATVGPAPDTSTTGNPAFNSPWSFTGQPTVSFPTGHFADGLPLAVQLVGGEDNEAGVLRAALWCEKVLGVKPLEPKGTPAR